MVSIVSVLESGSGLGSTSGLGHTPYTKMAAVSEERGIKGCMVILEMCFKSVLECTKMVSKEDDINISFHKFPEDRELFRKSMVAVWRDIGQGCRVTDH